MTSECSICCLSFNKTIRKQIACESCNENICKQCVIHWLKERTNFTCPCCNIIWSTEFCYNNISAKIVESYKKIHMELVFKMEQSFIPDTQPFIEVNKRKEIYEDELKKLIELRKKCIAGKGNWKNFEEFKDVELTKKEYKENINMQIRFLEDRIDKIENCINNHHNIELLNQNLEEKIIIPKENKKICSCPNLECRGFIMGTNYKCGICEIYICKKCHIRLSDEPHECKKEDMETIKLILQDSKPCPKCFTRISKVDGCDQMFCINCKTAFSWNTGKIETGRIHNPHYYEELRRLNNGIIPREPGDNPVVNIDDDCEEPIVIPGFRRYYFGSYWLSNENIMFKVIYNENLTKYTINNENLMRYRNANEYDFNSNFKNRFKYICNKIDQEKFKRLSYAEYKNFKYRKEIYDLVNEYQQIYKRILKHMYMVLIPNVDFDKFKELNKLQDQIYREYANKNFIIHKYYEYLYSTEFFLHPDFLSQSQ